MILIVNITTVMQVAGWGEQYNNGPKAGIPHWVELPIVHTDTCRASNAAFHQLTSNHTLCAGSNRYCLKKKEKWYINVASSVECNKKAILAYILQDRLIPK